jgi:putative transposase
MNQAAPALPILRGKHFNRNTIDASARSSAPVVESADGKLAAIAQCSERERATIAARLEILQMFDRFHKLSASGNVHEAAERFAQLYKTGAVPVLRETLRTEASLSGRTLRRWRSALRRGGPAALANHYGNRRACGIIDQRHEFAEFLIAGLARWSTRFHPRRARELLAIKFPGERIPSVGACGRWLRRYHREHPALLAAWRDRDHFRSNFAVKFGTRRGRSTRPGERIFVDGSPADFELLVEGRRHHILLAVDDFSEFLVAVLAPSESIESVLALVRAVALELCVPELFVCDRGSGFISERTERAVRGIGSDIEDVGRAYAPELKGEIESHVRVVHRLTELIPGFAGHSVAEKQELRGKFGFAGRRGLSTKSIFGAQLSFTEAQAWLRECVVAYNNRERESLGGRSPIQILAGFPDLPRVSDRRALDLALLPLETRTVGRAGIRFAGGSYAAAELAAFIGESVFVARDPDDVGRLLVFRERQKHGREFLCVATDLNRLGVAKRRDLALAAKQVQREVVRGYRRHMRRLVRQVQPEKIADELRRRGAAAGEAALALLPPGVAHTTPALDAAADAARALDAFERPQPAAALDDRSGDAYDEVAEAEKAIARFEVILSSAPGSLPSSELSWACAAIGLPEIQSRWRGREVYRLRSVLAARRAAGVVEDDPDGWIRDFESDRSESEGVRDAS